MDPSTYRKLDPRSFVLHCLASSVRTDGRRPNAPRRTSLTVGSITSAVGSAMAKIGRTTVVAGVEATVSRPPPGTPNTGLLDVNVQLLPLIAGAGFGSGFVQKAELKRYGVPDVVCLSEFVRENVCGFVDMDALCIEADQLVWNLVLSVYCIDLDGSPEDAMLLACWAALRDVKLPTVQPLGEIESDHLVADGPNDHRMEEDSTSENSVFAVASADRTESLKISDMSFAISFAIVENTILLDPTKEEQAVADSKITLVFRPNGELRAVHKPGGKSVSLDKLATCHDLAQAQVQVMYKLLESPTSDD